GLPLNPLAVPVFPTLSEVALPMIRTPSVRPPRSTPTISASNSSTLLPSKTVLTIALEPAGIWSGVSVGTGAESAGAERPEDNATTDVRREIARPERGVTGAEYSSGAAVEKPLQDG